ncbi:MAG: HU family DNA-binding protein, partial [Candidatus Dechloromonas phosphoritropha]
MNKDELIEALSARAELSKAQAASAIDGLVDIITAAITKGESVALIGFDTFKSVMRVAREGSELASGEKIKKAAAKFSKLSGGATLKAVLVGKKA